MIKTLFLSLLFLLFQNGHDLYQQALVQERGAGNLEKAIQLFQDAAKNSGGDRTLAAQALMGAARCYEKLGQVKANELYDQVVHSYADQQEQASEARERIAALHQKDHGITPEAAYKDAVKEAFLDKQLRDIDKQVKEADRQFREASKQFKFTTGQLWEVGPGVFWDRQPLQLDASRTVMIKGVVKNIEWTNPHVIISVEGLRNMIDPKPAMYRIQCTAPDILVRDYGWTRETVRIGDTITAEGLSNWTLPSPTIGFASITLSNAKNLSCGNPYQGEPAQFPR